jgi:DNA polymerase III delta subunit
MIYLLHGTDTKKAREKLHTLLDSMFAKKPDASFVRVDNENFDDSRLEEFIRGQGLFESKYIVVFDNVFTNKDAKETVLKILKEISSSKNIFIFLEEKLNKTELLKLQKYSEKVQEFSTKDIPVKKKFDIFSITDAFGKRNAKNLWTLYQKAKLNNISDEEIHGILFWQVKSMLLAQSASNPEETGLNPFVFRKSTDFLKNYTSDELIELSSSLVSLYHDARGGMHELGTALERFILSI